jgi:hypothetical protein
MRRMWVLTAELCSHSASSSFVVTESQGALEQPGRNLLRILGRLLDDRERPRAARRSRRPSSRDAGRFGALRRRGRAEGSMREASTSEGAGAAGDSPASGAAHSASAARSPRTRVPPHPSPGSSCLGRRASRVLEAAGASSGAVGCIRRGRIGGLRARCSCCVSRATAPGSRHPSSATRAGRGTPGSES